MSNERIALTFDDGPGEGTEKILDLLCGYSARATFFVIGCAAQRRSDLLRRMDAEGHEIGNHTWSHPRLARDCDDAVVREELERTNMVLSEVVGRSPERFRAPHYDVDARVLGIAAELGLRHTKGDIIPPDWDERFSAAYLTVFVVQQARADLVIGLHDGVPPGSVRHGARQQTIDAVASIVPRLLSRGLECVTASEVLGTS